jgi:hypothetical protein
MNTNKLFHDVSHFSVTTAMNIFTHVIQSTDFPRAGMMKSETDAIICGLLFQYCALLNYKKSIPEFYYQPLYSKKKY